MMSGMGNYITVHCMPAGFTEIIRVYSDAGCKILAVKKINSNLVQVKSVTSL